jgi:hypothetical protein
MSGNLSGRMTRRGREMMAGLSRGKLGRVNDPGHGYRDFLSYFRIPIKSTYCDELIHEDR